MTPEKEAAELLPCSIKHLEGYDFGFSEAACPVCSRRPAVAERLRQRDEKIADLEDARDWSQQKVKEAGERIAALEPQRDKAQADYANEAEVFHNLEKRIVTLEAARNEAEALVLSHEGHIAKLEAENERLAAALKWYRRFSFSAM